MDPTSIRQHKHILSVHQKER